MSYCWAAQAFWRLLSRRFDNDNTEHYALDPASLPWPLSVAVRAFYKWVGQDAAAAAAAAAAATAAAAAADPASPRRSARLDSKRRAANGGGTEAAANNAPQQQLAPALSAWDSRVLWAGLVSSLLLALTSTHVWLGWRIWGLRIQFFAHLVALPLLLLAVRCGSHASVD